MTYNAPDEDVRVGADYVKLEDGAKAGAHGKVETSTSGCCGGGDADVAAVGGWWWSLWWWAKLVLVVLFVGVLGAVFFKWIGPFFMDKVNKFFNLLLYNFRNSYINGRSYVGLINSLMA